MTILYAIWLLWHRGGGGGGGGRGSIVTQVILCAQCALPSKEDKGHGIHPLRMCHRKNNEYIQTTLLGVELLCVMYYI